jgi:lauroyl/myristoyl acyltransferase
MVGIDHLAKAAAHGRGVLLITAHYGNFEYLPAAVRSWLAWAHCVVYRGLC